MGPTFLPVALHREVEAVKDAVPHLAALWPEGVRLKLEPRRVPARAEEQGDHAPAQVERQLLRVAAVRGWPRVRSRTSSAGMSEVCQERVHDVVRIWNRHVSSLENLSEHGLVGPRKLSEQQHANVKR